jgi:hypothetical protein
VLGVNLNKGGERMNLEHPMSVEFANGLDKICGGMIERGLEKETMFWLADELASMLSNDRFKAQPLVPHSENLYRLVVAVSLHLRGKETVDQVQIERWQESSELVPTS